MPAAHGRENQGVIGRLLEEPQRFGFFQAVRLALQWLGEQGVPPGQALARHIRFRNSLSMGFPASEVEQLELVAPGPGEEAAAPLLCITPAFMGLLGAHGALPAHYTERVLAWQASEQDEAPRAFLDLLSNRMLALCYEAWRKYRVEHAIGEGTDGFMPLLLALAGCGGGGEPTGPDSVRAEAIALYAGLLQQRPVSSVVLGRILASYLGVGLAVEEMVDYWDVMSAAEQSALGGANAALGDSAVAGARCWRPDLRARLRVGPLDRAAYERFLPGRPAALALRALLGLFGEPTLVYEVALVLRADAVQPAILAANPGAGARLGLDSFVVDGPAHGERTDMRYDLRPMAPLKRNT